MKAPDHVETSRLILRRPRRSDAAAIFAGYASDPEVTRYVSWPRHESVEATDAFLAFSDSEWAKWPAGPYLVVDRRSGALLGGSGVLFATAARAATGYVLATHAWGHGYATEALAATVDIAREVGLVRLEALAHHEHRASARVLEKCGFTREGILRRHSEFPNLAPGEPCDVACYARILR